MRLHRLSPAVFALLVLAPAAPAAQRQGDDSPTIVVRIRSLDTIIGNAKLFARLIGKEEVGNQVEQLIKLRAGPNGLDGIDMTRPLGAYARISDDLTEAAAVLMLPIADESAFLGLLENLNYKAQKDKDGLYVIQQDQVPFKFGFRLANKYAYVTGLNLQAIAAANLVDPSVLFPSSLKADVSASVRLDRIPKTARDLALARIEEGLAKEKEKSKPGENEVQRQARMVFLDAFARQAADVLTSGRDLTGQVNIDPKRQQLSLQVALDARPGSDLAKEIAALGKNKSLFGGLITQGAAINGQVHLVLPGALRQALEPVIDDGLRQAAKKETNPAKRRQLEHFNKALAPSLKSGELDAGFSLRGPGPSRLYTVVAGVKLKEGAGVEQAVRELLKELPEQKGGLVKLDVETAGDVKIHRIDAQGSYDEKARQAFGNNPVYVAFRADAVLASVGEDGLEALKQALAARPEAGRSLLLEASMAQLAATLGKTEAERKAAREVFGPADHGTVRLVLQGGPSLRLRLSVDLSVLRFAATTYGRARAGADSDQ